MVETRCKSKNMNLRHVSSFSYPFRLLFIIITKKPVNSRQFILKNCFKVFKSVYPYFENFSI